MKEGSPIKISIALCTYNGASFLPLQMESLAAQTRLPDEMVAVDDGSTDDTVKLLRAFAKQAPFPVRIEVNTDNLGVTRNFEKAIGLCIGDVTTLCDQDDIWRHDKLARMERAFLESPLTALIFSDAQIIGEDGKPEEYGLWACSGFGEEQKRLIRRGRAFDALVKYNFITGCTLAFRTSLRDIAFPTPPDAFAIHDGWLALVAATVADIDFIEAPLVQYRQHASQQIGVEAPGTADRWGTRLGRQMRDVSHYRRHLRHLQRVHEKLVELREMGQPVRATDRQIEQMQAHSRHLQARLSLPASRLKRMPIIVRELVSGRYGAFSGGLRSVLADLFG